MATITHTFTDNGRAMSGTVTATPYTVTLGKATAGTPVSATLNGSGVASLTLADNAIVHVVEDLKMRGRIEYVAVVAGSTDLHELPRFASVFAAHAATASGTPGPAGDKGDPGEGVPAGGTTGQVLVKASGDDFDTEWADVPA